MNQTPATTRQPSPKKTIEALLTGPQFAAEVAKAMPKHLKPERFIRIALNAMTKTPKLMQCTQESLFNCLLTLSALGLEPDGRRAHLIPFANKKANSMECTLIVDYKGLAELVLNSGLVSSIHADLVCDNDEFVYDKGVIVSHRINFREPRGKAYAVYCIVRNKDGSEKAEVMDCQDVDAIRDGSQGYRYAIANNTPHPWVSAWPEMAKKTVFRRLSKWVRLSPELRDAVEADDEPIIDIKAERVEPKQIFGAAPEVLPDPAPEPPDDVPMDPQPGEAASSAASRIAATEKKESGHDQLARVVTEAGHTFDEFQRWAIESGQIDDGKEYDSFAVLPNQLVSRMLRAQTGMLKGVAAMKSGTTEV